jgi:hypothetical protein
LFEKQLAPAVGFEPTTNRLTADRSTTELRWIKFSGRTAGIQFAQRIASGKFVSQIFDIDLIAGAAPPWRGAVLKVFGDQLAYKSRFLLFAF